MNAVGAESNMIVPVDAVNIATHTSVPSVVKSDHAACQSVA